jgi:hypothetical protein
MFGKKKLQKRINDLERQIDALWIASHIKVEDNKETMNMNPYHHCLYYRKKTEVDVAEVLCKIIGHLGLELEYKDGKPKRPRTKAGAVLVKNNCGVREVIG